MTIKQCIACKEDIKIDALKCKHCSQIQAKAANLQNKPGFNYLVFSLLGVFIIWIVYYIISVLIEEPLEPIFHIKSSNMLITESKNSLSVRCIGEIENPSVKRWSDFSLQAVFRSADGSVVDVLYSEPEVTIYPLFHFKGIVFGSGNASKNEYDSCELSVVNADDY